MIENRYGESVICCPYTRSKETFLESPVAGMDATKLLPVAEKSGETIGPYKLL